MAKSKVNDEMIYAELRETFPGVFPALQKIPHMPPKVGGPPERPVNEEKFRVEITEESSLEDIYLLLKNANGNRFRIHTSFKTSGTKTEYYYPDEDDNYHDEPFSREVTAYSDEIDRLIVNGTRTVENFAQLEVEYVAKLRTYHNRRSARREKEEKIKEIKQANRDQMAMVRAQNIEIWQGIGRKLAGKGSDITVLMKQRQLLAAKVEQIDKLLSSNSMSEE